MPPVADLATWMGAESDSQTVWFAKRLAANDTLATGAHQAGPYVPKQFIFHVIPSLNRPSVKNPDVRFELSIDSHPFVTEARAVWYNNKLHGGTRDETRLTNFGGAKSALLNEDSTGALVVFSFHRGGPSRSLRCHVWVCDNELEAELVEDRIGPVEPGQWRIWTSDERETSEWYRAARTDCSLAERDIPSEWLVNFPSGAEIFAKVAQLRPERGDSVDARLLERRCCEFELFKSVEAAVETPVIRKGYPSLEQFISHAHTVLQRRRARAGRSLELHMRAIFLEEGLSEGRDFEYQADSEMHKRPDFLFPSKASYRDANFPDTRLRMLAAKTTCKDRWRQVLNEADRIRVKHILTLQEGVSKGQFREMTKAGVRLVVPASLQSSYPVTVRPHLQTFESFIADVRLLTVP